MPVSKTDAKFSKNVIFKSKKTARVWNLRLSFLIYTKKYSHGILHGEIDMNQMREENWALNIDDDTVERWQLLSLLVQAVKQKTCSKTFFPYVEAYVQM